jgi:hypothetical protein
MAKQQIVRGPLDPVEVVAETAMKIVVSALVALSVLVSIVRPATALDAKTFYEQQERQSY